MNNKLIQIIEGVIRLTTFIHKHMEIRWRSASYQNHMNILITAPS